MIEGMQMATSGFSGVAILVLISYASFWQFSE